MTSPLAYVVDASVVVKLFLAEPLAQQAIEFGDALRPVHADCANVDWPIPGARTPSS